MPQLTRSRRPKFISAALIVALSSLSTACADGLSFRQDDALTIVAPLDGELVGEPLLVEWEVTPRPANVAGFVVFVDRAPQPAGKSIEHFKADNRSNIYETNTTSVEIPAFETATTGPQNRRNRHRILIVPVDAEGRRIGEGSEHIEIDVFREDP